MSVHFTITPDMERKLSGWHTHLQSKKTASTPQPCITLSREFGCQAYLVAEALQTRLNAAKNEDEQWVVLDRKLLEKISEESGFSPSEIEHARDTNPTFQSLVSMFMGQSKAEHTQVLVYTQKAIQHFAKAGNCIIVGRGAASFTQDFENCIHVRLIASMEYRCKIIMDRLNLNEKEAKEYIDQHQRQRNEFIKHYTKADLTDPAMYHLVINNEKNSADEIASTIESYMKIKNS